jgi:outer membrane lipoprotein SlyB
MSNEPHSPIFEELHPSAPMPLDGARAAPVAAKHPGGLPRKMWAVGGVLLLGIVGLGTALAVRSNSQPIDPNAELSKAAPSAGSSATGPAKANKAAAEVCQQCGTIESVQSERRKGEGSGVGAVAGGVLGGLAGNQMGKGSGKTALTVLGAVGGGFAGNAVEKNMKAYTVYHVKVRMDDGSERSFTEKAAPAVGARVIVDGNHYRIDTSANHAAPTQQ